MLAQALSLLPDGFTRYQRRLGAFVALSLLLHLLMALGAGPFDLSRRSFGDGQRKTELHATLAPPAGGSAEPAPSAAGASAQGSAADGANEPAPPAATQAAVDPGLSLPAADKWYTASELDVRAEPVARVNLHYPENVRAEHAVSTVRLRLFIDERGVVRKIQIAAAGPSAAFDEAARRAWEEVRFSPALKNGTPVKSQKLLELTYTAGSPQF